MSDTPPTPEPDGGGVDPERIRQAFTPRELGEWEVLLGLPLQDFATSYLVAMLAWWAAKQDGGTKTPDDFLDMSLGDLEAYSQRALDLLGKGPTGEPVPSGTTEPTTSDSSPSSPISTTSPSAPFGTSPA